MFKASDLISFFTEWNIPRTPAIPLQSASNPSADTVLDTGSETVGFRGFTTLLRLVHHVVVGCLQVDHLALLIIHMKENSGNGFRVL